MAIPITIASGIPTDLDVGKLIEAFPTIEPGAVVTYAQVEQVIGSLHGTRRFRTVTAAWRRTVLMVHNFVLETVPRTGFRRSTEVERSLRDRAGWRRDQSRSARRVRDLARVNTDGFDESERKSHDHARRVLQAHAEHTSATVRRLAPPQPPKQLPKRSRSKG